MAHDGEAVAGQVPNSNPDRVNAAALAVPDFNFTQFILEHIPETWRKRWKRRKDERKRADDARALANEAILESNPQFHRHPLKYIQREWVSLRSNDWLWGLDKIFGIITALGCVFVTVVACTHFVGFTFPLLVAVGIGTFLVNYKINDNFFSQTLRDLLAKNEKDNKKKFIRGFIAFCAGCAVGVITLVALFGTTLGPAGGMIIAPIDAATGVGALPATLMFFFHVPVALALAPGLLWPIALLIVVPTALLGAAMMYKGLSNASKRGFEDFVERLNQSSFDPSKNRAKHYCEVAIKYVLLLTIGILAIAGTIGLLGAWGNSMNKLFACVLSSKTAALIAGFVVGAVFTSFGRIPLVMDRVGHTFASFAEVFALCFTRPGAVRNKVLGMLKTYCADVVREYKGYELKLDYALSSEKARSRINRPTIVLNRVITLNRIGETETTYEVTFFDGEGKSKFSSVNKLGLSSNQCDALYSRETDPKKRAAAIQAAIQCGTAAVGEHYYRGCRTFSEKCLFVLGVVLAPILSLINGAALVFNTIGNTNVAERGVITSAGVWVPKSPLATSPEVYGPVSQTCGAGAAGVSVSFRGTGLNLPANVGLLYLAEGENPKKLDLEKLNNAVVLIPNQPHSSREVEAFFVVDGAWAKQKGNSGAFLRVKISLSTREVNYLGVQNKAAGFDPLKKALLIRAIQGAKAADEKISFRRSTWAEAGERFAHSIMCELNPSLLQPKKGPSSWLKLKMSLEQGMEDFVHWLEPDRHPKLLVSWSPNSLLGYVKVPASQSAAAALPRPSNSEFAPADAAASTTPSVLSRLPEQPSPTGSREERVDQGATGNTRATVTSGSISPEEAVTEASARGPAVVDNSSFARAGKLFVQGTSSDTKAAGSDPLASASNALSPGSQGSEPPIAAEPAKGVLSEAPVVDAAPPDVRDKFALVLAQLPKAPLSGGLKRTNSPSSPLESFTQLLSSPPSGSLVQPKPAGAQAAATCSQPAAEQQPLSHFAELGAM